MSDLISKAELFNRLASVWTIEDVYSTVQDMPTVEAEVVIRCMDCKHYRLSELSPRKMCCRYVIGQTVVRNSNDFCSRAERWEDGETT